MGTGPGRCACHWQATCPVGVDLPKCPGLWGASHRCGHRDASVHVREPSLASGLNISALREGGSIPGSNTGPLFCFFCFSHFAPSSFSLKKKNIESFKNNAIRSTHCGTVETNLTGNHEAAGSIPGLAQQVKEPWRRSQMQLGSGIDVAVM